MMRRESFNRLQGVLEDEGFRVATARSGEEAIRVFQQEEPDVTLLDIWMPGMDGIEVLKRLKWIAPECQVIMISGHATISTAMTSVKLGAFDFIEKPLSLDVLLHDHSPSPRSSEGLVRPRGIGENCHRGTLSKTGRFLRRSQSENSSILLLILCAKPFL